MNDAWTSCRAKQDELAERLHTLREIQETLESEDQEAPERLIDEIRSVRFLHQQCGCELENIGEAIDNMSDAWGVL